MELGKARLAVEVDAAGARTGVNDAVRAFDILKRRGMDAVQGIGGGFSKLKDMVFSLQGAVAGFGLGVLIKSFIDAGRETENYSTRLQVLLGSVSEGKRLFKEMNEFAARTPFEFREVMGAATQLSSVLKGGVDEVRGYMPMIADLAAASGMGIEDATGQVVRMLSAGASAADRFRETGINAMLGFQTGVKYSAEETRKILIAAWEDPQSKFRDAAKLLVNTWDGAMSNLQDSWFQFQQRVMIDGGVLDYLKAIVQVIAEDFNESFGIASGAAHDFSSFAIAALQGVTNGIGAMIESVEFMDTAFQIIKTSASGIKTLWSEITTSVWEANSALATASRQRAEDSMEMIESDWFATEGDKLAAKQRYREALELELEATQKASRALADHEVVLGDNSEQVDKMFAAYAKFEEEADFGEFLERVNKKFEENRVSSEGAEKNIAAFKSGLIDFKGPAGDAADGVAKISDEQKELNREQEEFDKLLKGVLTSYNSVYGVEQKRSESLALLNRGMKEGKINGEMYKVVLAGINKEYAEGIAEQDKYAKSLETIKSRYLDGYAASKTRTEAIQAATEAHIRGTLVGDEYAQILRNINEEYAASNEKAAQASEGTTQWQKTLENAAGGIQSAFSDFFVNIFDKGLDSFGDLSDGIIDTFKKMLAEMATIAIAKPIIMPVMQMMGGAMNGLTGQSTDWTSVLGQYFGGGMGGTTGGATGSGAGSFAQSIGSFFSSGTGGGGGMSNIMSGIGRLFGGAGSAAAGYGAAAPYAATYLGAGSSASYGVAATSTGVGTGTGISASGISTSAGSIGWVPIVGWIAAAMALNQNLFSQGWQYNKDDESFAGRALTLGAVGTADSILQSLGFSASTASLLSGSAIHTRLFGRKKPEITGTGTEFDFTQSGVSGSRYADILERGGIFRSDRRSQQREALGADDELTQELESFWEGIQRDNIDIVRSLGGTGSRDILASFRQEMDKEGEITKEIGTILGRTYEEPWEEFAMRIRGENTIAQIDHALGGIAEAIDDGIDEIIDGPGSRPDRPGGWRPKADGSGLEGPDGNAGWGDETYDGPLSAEIVEQLNYTSGEASRIAERWRDSAEDLLEGADFLYAATMHLIEGEGLLGAGSSLTQITDLVEELAYAGEPLLDTYSRLMEATTLLTDMMDFSGIVTNRTREEFVRFSSEVVEAAGGINRARQLHGSYEQNYFTEDEREAYGLRRLQDSVSDERADLGESANGVTFENFRERFTAVADELSPEDYVHWLELGDALARLNTVVEGMVEPVFDAVGAIDAYRNVFQDFQAVQEEAQMNHTQLLRRSADSFLEQASAYDGSAEAQTTLFQMLQDRYDMELAYLGMIQQAQEEINTTIDQSIERIRLSQMNEEEQYGYYREQANTLAASLGGMTDPEQIRETIARINELQQSAWGTLDEDQQSELSGEFLEFLEGIRTIANERLEDAEDAVETENEIISEALASALDRFSTEAITAQSETTKTLQALQSEIQTAGVRQQGIADQQTAAANAMLAAANILASAEIRVILERNTSEVGF